MNLVILNLQAYRELCSTWSGPKKKTRTHTLTHTYTHAYKTTLFVNVIFTEWFSSRWFPYEMAWWNRTIFNKIFMDIYFLHRTETHNRYYEIYNEETCSNRFSFSFVIEERRGKNPYVSTTNHHISNRSKTSSEGTLFSVSRTLSASKLTRWPLTRYRFIRFSLAYRERSQLQVDTRWLARF